MGESGGEWVCGFSVEPSRVPMATEVRSTLLSSSQDSLKRLGQFDRYLALCDAQHRPALTELVAGSWCPIAVGVAHYTACEALGLGESDLLRIGQDVEERLRKSILLNFARGVGITPMVVLGQSPKFWSRTFVGSEVRLERLGPKDARLTIAGFPFARYTYNRVSFRGIIASLVAPFCRHVTVKDAPEATGTSWLGWRIAWV